LVTSKRTSLQTLDEDNARQIVGTKNLAERQPEINLQINHFGEGLAPRMVDCCHHRAFLPAIRPAQN
jgi:hypothetical protein